jgi:putative endonuclease
MMSFIYQIADGFRHQARKHQWTQDRANGRRGEDIAHRFLQRAGMVIIARNYRMASGAGEIDLVGWDNERLVFVEVKARQTDEYGAPDRAIGREKRQSLLRAARDFARHAEVPWEKVRFDVVNVLLSTPPKVTHFRDIFSAAS